LVPLHDLPALVDMVAAGTVLATCLPAFNAAIACGAWSAIGELMWTASTFGSLSRSS
jgi:hypothetical protein